MADTDNHLDPGLMQYNLEGMAEYLKEVRSSVPRILWQLDDGAVAPTRAHPGDAGWDLYVHHPVWPDFVIDPGEFVDIPCGVRAKLPPGTWAMLTGRSSTLRKKGLMVNQGVIDNGYHGELYAGVWNLTQHPVVVERGERLAQLILLPLTHVLPQVVTDLGEPNDARGTDGFGSTGA